MFTGLVEELGKVKFISHGAKSVKITVEAKKVLEDVKSGDSIAVNGACLTVTNYGDNWFMADVMPETVQRTALAYLSSGTAVNLERTMQVGDRFGGHIVSGHIDGVGKIIRREQNDIAIIYVFSTQPEITRYVVEKGSIAIDGISLTVIEVDETSFSISMIPHTAAVTTLGYKSVGDMVNIEVDVIGKYVERLLLHSRLEKKAPLDMEFLAKNGFI